MLSADSGPLIKELIFPSTAHPIDTKLKIETTNSSVGLFSNCFSCSRISLIVIVD